MSAETIMLVIAASLAGLMLLKLMRSRQARLMSLVQRNLDRQSAARQQKPSTTPPTAGHGASHAADDEPEPAALDAPGPLTASAANDQ